MEEWQKHVISGLVSVLVASITAVVGFFVGRSLNIQADNRKASTERKNALRMAYADWFTSATLLKHHLTAFMAGVEFNPSAPLQVRGFLAETSEITSALKDAFHASHRAYLLDDNPLRRKGHHFITMTLEVCSDAIVTLGKELGHLTQLKEMAIMASDSVIDGPDADEVQRLVNERKEILAEVMGNHEDTKANIDRLKNLIENSTQKCSKAIKDHLKLVEEFPIA